MSMGKRIAELRKNKGWSQDELAEKLGMNRANISNYERNVISSIPSDVLMKLSDLFGVTVDFLLGRQENPDSPASGFLEKLDLSDDEFLKRHIMELDGKELTRDEALNVIAFLRTYRQLKK